jgi:hypothetical protein
MGCGARVALEMTGKIDKLTLLQSGLPHVVRVHENDSPPIVNAAVAIIETVNGCIELIVAADGRHPVMAGLQRLSLNSMDGEFGLPLLVREIAPVAGRMWQMKESFANALVEVFETRNDAGDGLADAVVTSDHVVPIYGGACSECGLGYTCYDRGFAKQVL